MSEASIKRQKLEVVFHELSSKELKRDLILGLLRKNPKLFIELAKDENVQC